MKKNIKSRLEKKGVSPVIATILLVSIVVILSVIVFLWIKGIAGEGVTKFDQNAEIICSDDIDFSASYSSGTLYITNDGNTPIFNMRIKVEKEGNYKTDDLSKLSGNWPEVGIKQQEGFSDSIDFGNATKITLIPVILGESNSKRTSFVCSDKNGYLISLK